MPQLRTTMARLESARRIVVEELWRSDQYTWTVEDQQAFESSLVADMLAEQWTSVIDMADFIYSWARSYSWMAGVESILRNLRRHQRSARR